MRIAVDCHMVAQPRSGDAGNARYTAGLVAALLAGGGPGDEVHALVAHPAARELLAPAPVHGVPAGPLRRLAWAAPRTLRAIAPDAAVFNYIVPPRAGAPLAVVVHDASFVHDPQWLTLRARTLLRMLVPRAVARARLVIAVSETAAADVSAALRVDPGRMRVVPNHVAPVFAPHPDAASRVAERFGLRRYALAVGDVSPRKNIPALAAAVAQLDDPGLELALVGRPGRRGREILDTAGGRWLGDVDDTTLATLYGGAAVVVCPSLYEGFGLPAIEALACGAPVVASRRGALPEVVGDAGILVEPDPAALAEGIRAALEPATADRLRAAGPVRAARYTREATGRLGWSALRECFA